MIRKPTVNDIPALMKLWCEVFGDTPEFVDDYFEYWFSTETALIEENCASAGYLMDMGTYEGKKIAMIYAVATFEDARGRGYASEIVNRLSEKARESGFAFTYLHPAEASLFGYYTKRTNQHTAFFARRYDAIPEPGEKCAEQINAYEYHRIRESLFRSYPHVNMSDRAITWFTQYGGKLFKIGDIAVAALEKADGEIYVRELISPILDESEALSYLAFVLGRGIYHVTAPDWDNECKTPSGMADGDICGFSGLAFE